MRPSDRLSAPAKAPRIPTTAEILVSTTCLTLLMLLMIEAVFLFW